MKKLINIHDDLYSRIEKIQRRFFIKSTQPVIDIVIAMGLEAFERLIEPQTEEKVYIWPWYPAYPPYHYKVTDTTTPGAWVWNKNGYMTWATGSGTWRINLTGSNYDVSYQE